MNIAGTGIADCYRVPNTRKIIMQYLYGIKPGKGQTLVATFDREEQLLAYVRWATLGRNPDGSFKFEQGSALSGGFNRWEHSSALMTADEPVDVAHNPSPSML